MSLAQSHGGPKVALVSAGQSWWCTRNYRGLQATLHPPACLLVLWVYESDNNNHNYLSTAESVRASHDGLALILLTYVNR